MTKIKKTNSKKLLISLAIFGLLIFNYKNRIARGVDCNSLTGDAEQQCKDLEKKAAEYKDLIDLKNQQQDTLQKQLATIDADQKRNQIEYQVAKNKVDSLSGQISSLESQIQDQEKMVTYDRAILTGLMQSYYEDYQKGILGIVLINKNFSDILNQSDYLTQSSLKVSTVLASINDAKQKLESNQIDLVQKKTESDQLKTDLENKTYYLQANENQKQSLMTKTAGEEAKYQQLLAQVERQKLQLFDFSSVSNASEVYNIVSNYPKPDQKYWATSWYFRQDDPRWAGTRIGLTDSTMKKYGCAIASVSMVFKKYGSSIDPGKMAKQSIFDEDLIEWNIPKSFSWNPSLTLITNTSDVNWATIKNDVLGGQPVIVHINRSGGGHYVVIHNYDETKNDYVVNDPYFGDNIYLGASKMALGSSGAKSNTSIDQMIIYKK